MARWPALGRQEKQFTPAKARPDSVFRKNPRPTKRFDVNITVYYRKNYQAYLVLIMTKLLGTLKFHANLHDGTCWDGPY